MKRLALLVVPVLALCVACGSSAPDVAGPPPGAGRHLSNGDWAEVAAGPDAFRGATVTLTGRVFSIQNSGDKRYRAIKIWADPRTGGQETTIIAQRGLPMQAPRYPSSERAPQHIQTASNVQLESLQFNGSNRENNANATSSRKTESLSRRSFGRTNAMQALRRHFTRWRRLSPLARGTP